MILKKFFITLNLSIKSKLLAALTVFLCLFCLSLFPLVADASSQAGGLSSLPVPQHWQTKNGVRVYFLPMMNLPMLDVRLLVGAGSSYDGADDGLAMLTNHALAEGTQDLTALQVKDQLDQFGSQLKVLTGREIADMNLRCLTDPKSMNASLSLFHDLLSAPRFRELDIGRVKSKMIAALDLYQHNPNEIATLALFKHLYPGQPYAHRPLGSEKTLSAITRQQVVHFYEKYYVASNMNLVLVGAITRQSAVKIANQLTAGLPRGLAAKALPLASNKHHAQEVDIHFPSTQTHIMWGQVAIGYHNPLYFPLKVASYILGNSGLTSRLYHLVREKEGLAYDVRSDFVPSSYRGIFSVSLQTHYARSAQAMQIVEKELQHYLQQGPTAAEVQTSKKAMQGRLMVGLLGRRSIINALSLIAIYHLPLDFYRQSYEKLGKVTRQNIIAALQKVLTQKEWVRVVVGPKVVTGEKETTTKKTK